MDLMLWMICLVPLLLRVNIFCLFLTRVHPCILQLTATSMGGGTKVTINLWWKFRTLLEAAMMPRPRCVEEDGEVWGGGIALPIRLGGLGERHKLLAGSGAEPRPKMNLVSFELNKTHFWQTKTSKWSTAFRSTAWTATHLDVKSGQIRDNVRNILLFKANRSHSESFNQSESSDVDVEFEENARSLGTLDNSASRVTSRFLRDRPSKFGTVPKNSGRMVTLGGSLWKVLWPHMG